jgi:uncharacterized protein (TIGR02453 family)
MIQKSSLQFLTDLKKHNNKEWFDANRKRYDAAKEDIYATIEKLIPAIGTFDKAIAQLQLKDCVFRINRDIRFAKDKTPYKTNIAGYFAQGGKKSDAAGFYMHIEPGKSFLACGCWWPEAPLLSKIRQEIDYNFDDFKKTITTKKFKDTFGAVETKDTLQRAPKGYEETNPAMEFLKLKSFVITKALTDEEIQHKDLIKNITAVYKAAKPFVDFLNTAQH